MGELEVRGKLICFTIGKYMVYRVHIKHNLIESVPKLRELVEGGKIGVCLWEECIVASVVRQGYTYKGEKRYVYYITIPKRVVEEYGLKCGDDVTFRVVLPEGGSDERGRVHEDYEDTEEQ